MKPDDRFQKKTACLIKLGECLPDYRYNPYNLPYFSLKPTLPFPYLFLTHSLPFLYLSLTLSLPFPYLFFTPGVKLHYKTGSQMANLEQLKDRSDIDEEGVLAHFRS